MHFVSVDPKLAENIASKQSNNPFRCIKSNDLASFVLKPVTGSHVLKCLKQLRNGKACGPDKISTTLVKDAANFISYSLTLIYNSSMQNSTFPTIVKQPG